VVTISVIIPAYNGEKTILETIQSVRQQTFTDIEIIVINDGSKDSTVSLVSAIDDPRIKIYSYENGGLPTARNRGIARATGAYLSFIDADDLWTPNKLEAQLNALQQHPEAGVAYSWTAFINENSQFIYAYEPIHHEGDVHTQLFMKHFVANGSNIMIKRECVDVVGEFDPTLKSAEDWDYCLRLAAKFAYVVVPEYQILYRRSSTSMSSKVHVMEESYKIVHERAFLAAPEKLQPVKNKALADAYYFHATLHLAHQRDTQGVRKAIDRLLKAIQLYPPMLLQRNTQRLLLKCSLLNLLPYSIAVRWSRWFGEMMPNASTKPVEIVANLPTQSLS
jgi:glycosyltransferase involved in cell wall biosynthesis